MPPINGHLLKRDFDRAVILKLYNHELDERRAWERELSRAQAQMVAMMTWCKHPDDYREETEHGFVCGACGMRFR